MTDAPDPATEDGTDAATGDLTAPRDDASAPPRRGQGRTLFVSVLVLGVVFGGLLIASPFLARDVADPDAPQPQPTAAVAGEGGADGFGLTDAVDRLPDATLTGFAGGDDVAVDDLLGGAPLVVNFWATWCAPCVAEMPDLQRLHEAAGDAVRLVGINTQDAEVNAEPFVDELGISYDLLVDRDGDYYTATGSFGMPTTLFVRPDGTVAYRHTGVLTLDQAVQLVDEHLGVTLTV